MSQKLENLLRRQRRVRVIGFDDAPFVRGGRYASISGVVCSATRFEGMVWGRVTQDGWNSTDVLIRLLRNGKFLPQLHAVLLDGIAFGGFNIVDLPRLSAALRLPCVAVTRRPPDMDAVKRALQRLSRPDRRWALIERAGPIHSYPNVSFQVAGATPEVVAEVLQRTTDQGHVPEALRLAHLIGAAVKTGESGRRA